jgi:glucose/arabinose dehydrogenase
MNTKEPYKIDYNTKEEIWRTSPLHEEIHNGGGMDFSSINEFRDNTPKLYITTGDSGRKATASSLKNVLGSIIRLNDDGTIPEDNPFTIQNGYTNSYRCADTNGIVPTQDEIQDDENDDAVCGEVYGYGFRNPFR